MSKPFLSPVSLDALVVFGIEFNVEPDGPSGDYLLNLTLESPRNELRVNNDKRYESNVELTVKVSLADDGESKKERMHASVHLACTVSVTTQVGGEDAAKRYLRANGVSMLYSHARACLMTVAGMSPMNSFVLPPIDPVAYVDSIAEEEMKDVSESGENATQ